MKIAWIGTGMMGTPMARLLAHASYEVILWDSDRDKLKKVGSEIGLDVAYSQDSALEGASVVMTMLGYPSDVEDVYLGPNGLINKCTEGTIIIDLTTSSPDLARKIEKAGNEKGISVLDAPVSGGVKGAERGELVVMVGGNKEVFDSVEPLLKVFSKAVFYMGESGSGQHTKAANQIVIAAHMAAFTEAIIYCRAVGIDPGKVLSVISGGAAGSWQLSNAAPKTIAGDYKADFFVKHFIKDLLIINSECKERDVKLPVLEKVLGLYLRLQQLGYENEGTQSLILAYDCNDSDSNEKHQA